MGYDHCATRPAVGDLSLYYTQMFGTDRASFGLAGTVGLACEAGPLVPSSHGVIWATLWQSHSLKFVTCTGCYKAGKYWEEALGRWLPPEWLPLYGDAEDWFQTDRPWHNICVDNLGQTTEAAGFRALCMSVLTMTWRLLAGPVSL